ncbi:quinon protein alcohol dehydrogenase-like superfamily, partial [Butyriboletus roseoflavus]
AMLTIQEDQTIVLDTGRSGWVSAIAFQPDGKHLLGGSEDGIRRWRLSDGQEVTMQMGTRVYSISVSRDGKWIACGAEKGASVWDGEMREKVIDMEGGNEVWAVDISLDSTRFATGTNEAASIWSLKTGERLVGPLKHDNIAVTGVEFSPGGEHIATACWGGSEIRIFDSRNGDELITINAITPKFAAATPLAWSSDGQRIFATSQDNKIKSFDVSTGSQLAELQILSQRYYVHSLALAPNGKFIATFGDRLIVFLDTSTLSRTGPVIDGDAIQSIAISQDNSYLATGRADGTIVVRHLNGVLADSPFVTTHEEDERPSISGSHNSKVRDSTACHFVTKEFRSFRHQEDKSSRLDWWLFYSPLSAVLTLLKSLSPESFTDPREDEIPPVGSSHVVAQSSDHLIVTYPPEARREENPESSKGTSVVKRWLQTRLSNKDPVPHKPNQLSGESRESADRRSPSHSPASLDDRQEGPSWMAVSPARNKIIKWRTVRCSSDLYAGTHHVLQDKSRSKTTTPKCPNEGASHSGQGTVGATEADPVRLFP